MNATDDLEDAATTRATCAVVGTVSPNRLFLEPHGNYNPSFEKTALETSKAQFQIISPALHAEFETDFNRGIKNIEILQKTAIKEGPAAEHFVVTDGTKKALKFSWPLFEKRAVPYDRKSPNVDVSTAHLLFPLHQLRTRKIGLTTTRLLSNTETRLRRSCLGGV